MPRGSAAVAAALAFVLWARPAGAGAGFGELCETRYPVAHGFYWSDTLHDLVGPSFSVDDVTEVAWDERYVFAKTVDDDGEDGPWYVIDTTGMGDAVVEHFPAASEAWTQRLAELGRGTLTWRYPSSLPRSWNLGCNLLATLLLLPLIVLFTAADHPLLFGFGIMGLILFAIIIVRAWAELRARGGAGSRD